MIRIAVALTILFLAGNLYSQVTYDQSKKASRVIGKWLARSSGHYDFLSATSVNPKRAGDRFFGLPDMQTASDYGISLMNAPRDKEVTEAYRTIGADTSSMERSISLSRLHVNLGFANKHDFSFSYQLPTRDEIQGWGAGYKRVLFTDHIFYLSWRLNYSRSSKENYFESSSLMNDLSISLYLRLIDLYAGVRHWSGKVKFNSSIPELRLPTVEYFSTSDEIEHYFGVLLATTMNTRFTMEANSIGKEYAVAGKFSFHFDSLLPTFNNWFRDPRYIRQ